MSVIITDNRPSILLIRNGKAQDVQCATWQAVYPAITLPNGETDEVQDDSLTQYGIIGTINLSLPDTPNGVTCAIEVRDSDGYILYSKDELADDTDHPLTGVDIIVTGTITIGLTPSADPGADWIAKVKLYGV